MYEFKEIKRNKKAYLDYEILEEFICGIQLKGYEVKQIRTGNVDIRNAFCKVEKDGIYIHELNIPLYEKTSFNIAQSYNPKRKRKILVTKKQLRKIAERTNKTGYVLIPLAIGCGKRCRRIKIKCALAKLRRKVEKKQIIKERDIAREMDRTIKSLKF